MIGASNYACKAQIRISSIHILSLSLQMQSYRTRTVSPSSRVICLSTGTLGPYILISIADVGP